MDLIQLIGRFHPLVVHFPVAILLLAPAFEFLSRMHSFRKLKAAVLPTLLIGACSSLIAVGTGLLLSQEGGYDDDLLYSHRNLGLATTFVSFLFYFVAKSKLFGDKAKRRKIRALSLIPVTLLVILTGHWGGSLTHGEDYLTIFLTDEPEESTTKIGLPAVDSIETSVMYADVIQPILEARCYGCHSAKKQKGGLRLDGREYLLRGGKHGDVLSSGIVDSSALYHRLTLPLEDKKHMPPNEKPQLSSAEIDLIHTWVADGYSFDKTIAAYGSSEKIKNFIALVQSHQTHKQSWVPDQPVTVASADAIRQLENAGVLVMPVAAESNYLMANFVNARAANNKALDLLLPIREQLVWLDLGHTQITNDGIVTLGKLTSLRLLYLNHTSIDETGLRNLLPLKNLTYLNIVGTQAGDRTLEFTDSFPALTQLYLYQTKINPERIREFIGKNKRVIIDSGSYHLPALPTDTVVYSTKRK